MTQISLYTFHFILTHYALPLHWYQFASNVSFLPSKAQGIFTFFFSSLCILQIVLCYIHFNFLWVFAAPNSGCIISKNHPLLSQICFIIFGKVKIFNFSFLSWLYISLEVCNFVHKVCFAVFLLEILIIINFSYGCTLCVLWNSIEIWISTSCLLCLLSSKISRSLIFSMHLLADLSYLFFSFTVICIWIDRWNFWFHSTSASPGKGLSGIHHVIYISFFFL